MRTRHMVLCLALGITVAGCATLPDAMRPIEFSALPINAQKHVLREVPNATSYRTYHLDSRGESQCYIVFMDLTPTNTVSMVFDLEGKGM